MVRRALASLALGVHRVEGAVVVKPTGEVPLDWGVGHYERTAEMLLPAADVLVHDAGVRAGERVVDVGCGTGNAALLAAAEGADVTAVDPSPRLLAVTSARAEQQHVDVTCALGQAASIPAPDRAFDCVLSNFGVIFAADADAAVKEMARVLAFDGRVALTSWLPGGGLGALAKAAQELVRSAVGAPPGPPGFAWHDESALTALFLRYGMTTTLGGPHELTFTATSPEDYLDAEMKSHPMAVTGLEVLQQRGQAEQALEQLLEVLRTHNEDPKAFRSTSRYVVVLARRM